MERQDFKSLVESTLQDVLAYAEETLGIRLPRQLAFRWLGSQEIVRTDVVEAITSRVYVDRDDISPCVDIGPCEVLDGNTTLITGIVAGYPPAPFDQGHGRARQGHAGPFIHAVFGPLFPNPILGRRRRQR
jgi:hypothetical protein